VRHELDQHKSLESGHVEFAGKALDQIVLSAINAVSGFREGVSSKVQNVAGFRCKRCVDGQLFREVVTMIMINLLEKLECVDKFHYFGDLIGAGGGAEEASRARVCNAWAKFNELAPVLTSRGASIKVKGKVYRACIHSVLGYASETWTMKVEYMVRLARMERMMIRWMCGVHLTSRTVSAKLNSRLGIECITDVVR